ncbi:MAG: (Fe-S)-binding protein [Myxococcota bacterium]
MQAIASTPNVVLMASCLCDAFFADVAIATVEVLEHLGCRVTFPEAQTCCSQPAFNAGDWQAARRVARHTLHVFRGDDPVVVPSGSCARMLSHGALMLFEGESDRGDAVALGRRSFELAEYIVDVLGVKRWGGRLEQRVAFHRSCHSRGTRYSSAALALLASIDGLELVDFEEIEQCCGFGGTFSIGFPEISAGVGQLKIEHVQRARVDTLVSADMGCLMHLSGLSAKRAEPLSTRHLAQVLRDAVVGEKAT